MSSRRPGERRSQEKTKEKRGFREGQNRIMYQEFMKETENFIFVEDRPEKADIIFVPGNGYPQMAERAAALYRDGYAGLILPSGKYSITAGCFSGVLSKEEEYAGSYRTEWEFLRDVLIKNGVAPEHILREESATYTYENALFSKKVTDAAGIQVKKAILCCKSYHSRRVLMYYQCVYPETKFLVCPSFPDEIRRENWNQSEAGVEAVTGELTRIIRQFSLMMSK